MKRLELLLSLVLVFLSELSSTWAGQHQKRLLDKLFKNYDASERPVYDETQPLNVSVGMSLQQIVDVDEKKQTIIFSGWLDLTWTDYNLQWNPAEYGNISVLRIMSTKIWVPDLLLYNSADDSFDTTSKVNAVIYHDGTVSYLPPGMFKATCMIKIDDFPFDEQKCSLKFGSWTHDEAAVNLTNKADNAQLDSYIKNGEWFLMGVTSYYKSITYECCPEKFPFVMFEINLRRRTLYFVVNLIFPCILISFMSVLGFSLPPDSGEKIGLEITTLLSIIMFSQIITGIIPESSLSVPKIALYFASVMVISGMSIIANVFVLILHHRNVKNQQPMPRWVEVLFCEILAKILRMKRPSGRGTKCNPLGCADFLPHKHRKQGSSRKFIEFNQHQMAGSKYHAGNSELSSKSLLANVLDINDDFGILSHRGKLSSSKSNTLLSNHNNMMGTSTSPVNDYYDSSLHSSSGGKTSEYNPLRKSLQLILKELRQITNKLQDDEEDEEKALNWKFAAMVIDRLCMVVFATATILSTVLILLTSKNLYISSDPHESF